MCFIPDGHSDCRSMTSKVEDSATPKVCIDGGDQPDTPAQNMTQLSQAWKLSIPIQGAKKLLVLDVNGFLVASYKKMDKTRPRNIEHGVVGGNHVFKRPFCESFLQFCFENFHVGIWSSVRAVNVHKAVDFVCKEMKDKLAFIMHQTDCTDTGLKAPKNRFQPLFLKELTKVWTSFRPGEFNPSNTLLVDDSPYKALRNPPFTAIHPETYTHNTDDNFLSGPLQVYLEGLRDAANVQQFVRDNPIGVPAITAESQHWNLYRKIVTVDNLSLDFQNLVIPTQEARINSINTSISLMSRKDSVHIQMRSPQASSRITEEECDPA